MKKISNQSFCILDAVCNGDVDDKRVFVHRADDEDFNSFFETSTFEQTKEAVVNEEDFDHLLPTSTQHM